MKWAVVTLTKGAALLGEQLAQELSKSSQGDLYLSQSILKDKVLESGSFFTKPVEKPFGTFMKALFFQYDSLIFIMATGIVVRGIAPHLQGKTKDPAIVVMDEKGQYAISLLSGHLGGGNELAWKVGKITGAQPVITTASDVTNNLAVDMFAKAMGAYIESMERAKEVTALGINGEKLTVLTDRPFDKDILDLISKKPVFIKKIIGNTGLSDEDVKGSLEGRGGVIGISANRLSPLKKTVQLVPKVLSIGIGCRRDTPVETINEVLDEACSKAGVWQTAIKKVATIGLKANESGILSLCKRLEVPLEIISLEEIKKIQNKFKGSDFVEKTVGVRAVAEPCAEISGDVKGHMRLKRYAKSGVTIAIWEDRYE